ncbi:unnamed protein product [Sphenostylis stenocarpa]|uniref:Uncharacterized protein n=1 Tax=Sphenostylis stenocarpa TaxID=92480 RepID=A0AA86W6R8_9FABA|nr:unnamed protein product [Sphenostylis stenocarpa]
MNSRYSEQESESLLKEKTQITAMDMSEEQHLVKEHQVFMVVTFFVVLYSLMMMLMSAFFTRQLFPITLLSLFGIGCAMSIAFLAAISPIFAWIGLAIWLFFFGYVCYHTCICP